MNHESIKSVWQTKLPNVDLEKGSIVQTYRPSLNSVESTVQLDSSIQQLSPDESRDSLAKSEAKLSQESRSETIRSLGSEAWHHSLFHADERYKVEDEIARGGMGVIYEAQQQSLQRKVAVKSLRSEKNKNSRQKIFVSEAVVTARLEHPNIVPVYDLALREGDQLILAMKQVSGHSWRDVLKNESLLENLDANLDILLNVCNAVAFAHSKNIVHCDLKPDNVMVGDFGEVYVMDWGISLDISSNPDGHATPHTAIDSPCGTPGYMAPELAVGDGPGIGPHTDVYLLGAILYEILSGHSPHQGTTLMKVLYKACESCPPELSGEVPEELRELCMKALSKAPEQRFASVVEFQKALQGFRQHRESRMITEAARSQFDSTQKRRSRELSIHERSQLYTDFAEAVAGFRQATLLWSDNLEAANGEQVARIGFAKAALELGDVVLAETQCTMVAGDDPRREELQLSIDDHRKKIEQRETGTKRIRHFAVGLTLATVIGLIVGLALVNSARRESDRQRQLAEEQRIVAEQQRSLAEKNAEYAASREKIARETLEGLVGSVQSRLEEIPGLRARGARANILEVAFKGLRKLYGSKNVLASSTEAKARLELGELYRDVGNTDEAIVELNQSIRIYRALREKDDSENHLQYLGDSLLILAEVYVERDQLDQSVPHFEEAIKLKRILHESRKDELHLVASLMHCKLSYCNANQQLGNMEKSQAIIAESLKIGREALDQDPNNRWVVHSYFSALVEQAFHAQMSAGAEAAMPFFEVARVYGEKLAKSYPDHLFLSENLIRLYEGVASAQKELGQLGDARKNIERVYKQATHLVKLDPYRFSSRSRLADSCIIFANVRSNSGQFESAERLYKEGRDIINALLSNDPTNKLILGDLAVAIDGLTDLYIKEGKLQFAIATLNEYLPDVRLLSNKTENLVQRTLCGRFLVKLGRCYRRQKKLGLAEKTLLEACKFSKGLLGKDNGLEASDLYADALEELANIRRRLKKYEEADKLILESLEIDRRLHKAEPNSVRRVASLAGKLESLSISSLKQGETDRSITYAREMVAILEPIAKIDDSDANRKHDLGIAYYRLGHGLRIKQEKECLEVLLKAQKTLEIAIKKSPKRLLTRRQLSLAHYVRGAYLLEKGMLPEGYKELARATRNHRDLVTLASEKSAYQSELSIFQQNQTKIAEHLKQLGIKLPSIDEKD